MGDPEEDVSGFRDIFEGWLRFWIRALKMAFWRFDEHQTVVERLYAFVPLAFIASPALATLSSVPAWLALMPLTLFSFLWAPYLIYRDEHKRATRLATRLRPTLSLAPAVREFRKRDVLVACIRVTNEALTRVEHCSGQITSASRRRGSEPTEHIDISAYIRWSTGDGEGRYNTFQSGGILDVVMLEQAYLGAALICTVNDQGHHYLQIAIAEDYEYLFAIEVAADNCAPVRSRFRFFVEPKGQHAVQNGRGGLQTKPLPNVSFSQIE